MFSEQHSQGRAQEKGAEEIEDKMEPLHQCDAAQNHHAPHDQGAENTPDQSAMLGMSRDLKIRENQNENKDVIHAQRILDEVAGEKIEAVLRSFNMPDEKVEPERYEHPQKGPARRGAHTQLALAPLESEKIDPDRDKDADMKCDPKPNARRHCGRLSCCEARSNRKLQLRLFSVAVN